MRVYQFNINSKMHLCVALQSELTLTQHLYIYVCGGEVSRVVSGCQSLDNPRAQPALATRTRNLREPRPACVVLVITVFGYKMKMHIPIFDVVPARLNVGVMLFLACWVNYMLRVNMSVNIIAMVPDDHTASTENSECKAITTNDSLLRDDAAEVRQEMKAANTYDWTAQQQAYILSSYFWGYAITCLVSGTAAELWGPRNVVFYTMLVSAVLTILTPLTANVHYLMLVAARFVIGLAGGFIFPALHALVAHWAPPAEKGKFVSALLGGAIGTVVTWSLSGPLIENFGWSWAFYVPDPLQGFFGSPGIH